jgi:CRP/FNR family transcriptional regulator, cyclic AMP receptor protein
LESAARVRVVRQLNPFTHGEPSMTNHVIAAALNESLFGSLPEAVLRDLELTSRITRVPSGKLVYNPEVSVIVDGALRAFVDDGAARHLTVSYMYRPQSIGIAGAAGQEFPVGFQAIVPSTILRISRARFDELLQTHCQIGWAATRELARQLDDVLDETVRVAFHPVRARIAHHLLALTDIDHEEHAPVHQAELAAAVGSVREVVGRNVGSLRDASLVAVSQAGVAVINQEGLRRVAERRG